MRVGIVGCGRIAVEAHLPAYLSRPRRFTLAAVCDPADEARAAAARLAQLSVADTHSSVEALLRRDDIDAIDICAPPHLHRAIACAAASARKHVLCEKPIATTPADADAMIAAAREAGVTLAIVHNYLFVPEIVTAATLARSGSIGDVEVVISNFLGVPDLPGARTYRPNWRHEPGVAGGGILMDMMHAVYVAEELLGSAFERVSAWVWARKPGAPVEDVAVCRFEGARGVALVNVGWGDGPGGMEIAGSRGRISVRYKDGGTLWFAPLEEVSVTTAGTPLRRVPVDGQVDDIGGVLDDFFSALTTTAPPVADGEAAKRALEATVGAYRSAVTGQTVDLPLSPNDPMYLHGIAGLRELRLGDSSPVLRRGIFAELIPV